MKVILYAHPEDEDAVEEIECHSYAMDDIGLLWLYSRPNKPSHIITMAFYAQVEFDG